MWYKVVVDGEMKTQGSAMSQIQSLPFAFVAAGKPADMAVFLCKKTNGDPAVLYFSPKAIPLAQSLPRAEPCECPAKEGLSLLVGLNSAWNFLFSVR